MNAWSVWKGSLSKEEHKLLNAIQLKKVTLKDVAELSALSRQTFFAAFAHLNSADDMEAYAAQAFTEDKLQQELNTPGSTFYFAITGDTVLGFVKLNTGNAQNEYKDQNSLEVERLYVLAAYQGRQIGQQLLNFAFEQAKEQNMDFVWLGVWEHNHGAIRLYQRQGFVLCGSHDFMLGSDKQTDLLLKKELK